MQSNSQFVSVCSCVTLTAKLKVASPRTLSPSWSSSSCSRGNHLFSPSTLADGYVKFFLFVISDHSFPLPLEMCCHVLSLTAHLTYLCLNVCDEAVRSSLLDLISFSVRSDKVDNIFK